MVTAFDEPPKKTYSTLLIQETGSDRPSPETLERVDEIAADIGGFAFRFGIGSGEPALNTYEYGYILPVATRVDIHTLTEVREDLRNAGLDSPWVRVGSVWVDKEQLDGMELVGTPPEEALSGLAEFAEDFNDEYDG